MTILPLAVLVAAVVAATEMALVDLLMMCLWRMWPEAMVMGRVMESWAAAMWEWQLAVHTSQCKRWAAPSSSGGSCSDLYGGNIIRHQPWAVAETSSSSGPCDCKGQYLAKVYN